MISNERQYKITRSEVDRFRKAIGELTNGPVRDDVHPRLQQAEREAMESQLADLQAEIAEYDRLKSADLSMISINSFDELADGLIQARIAGRLSQKDLAERLGLKEQQIQRYEAERYASASYQRLREIANALGVRIRNDILLPVAADGFAGLVNKLRQVGLDREFLLTRLLPSVDAARANGEIGSEDDDYALTAKTGAVLERVFGWTRDNVFGAQALVAPRFAAAEARFKMPANRAQSATSLYAAYANYLAVVALKGARSLPKAEIPTDAAAMHRYILRSHNTIDLKSALHTAWDLGVVVLPLRDRGTFHGACWRYEGRNAVVLKQTSRHEARWLFDLLHEVFHASQRPDAETLEVIEADETSSDRRNSDEEIAASQFAGDVVLDGKAETLAQACVQAARNSIERLKSVVPMIAAKNSVGVGALANYLAFRLSWQGVNWWGAAANLQADDGDPWTIARDVFVERFPYDIDNELDRQLLDRALH
ncbi:MULTISPECIES: helix-turn-helix domain-containing protein [unclassified Mesorhizobium]|jgi:transcriptional regulator with XRE-family HTH domain|uniref:helix-turn-helix domain-containing protein n=1 Tax=unclassified Mesorhizobium TaxID=325217 RepID=UPI001CCEE824|nr:MULTISPECIES: helix-turn-helix transcriptional regulator [unclassified Mesorhizobium]MBZ9701771.1 helix-turn-helix domain-containing protein [Mesorhizobium sp. CO1-1-3]MBZ9949119.1 helix-turn-helix domain-containing protein [Mesorhizobium sp. BR1-1-11]